MDRDLMLRYLAQTGLPAFALDDDNFPVPGPVVRYYREQMRYTDASSGKQKHWSQPDLAQRLGLTKLMVRRMETQNKGLDSMDRRKTLTLLLNIPPVLLGLASDDQLRAMLSEVSPPLPQPSRLSHMANTEEIELYQDALALYQASYDRGSLQPSILTLEAWIARIEQKTPLLSGLQQQKLLALLWEYHMLAARSYMTDILDSTKSGTHLHHALLIAQVLHNPDLEAFVHYRTANMLFTVQRDPLRARRELDVALALSKGANVAMRGRILSFTALAYATTEHDRANEVYVQKLLEDAEKCIDKTEFHTVYCLQNRADTLISLGLWYKAHEGLDLLETQAKGMQRDLAYTNILRAEAYLKQTRPDYDMAAFLLEDILEQNKDAPVQYHVQYVQRLYELLRQSTYGNSPDVANIGQRLRKIKKG